MLFFRVGQVSNITILWAVCMVVGFVPFSTPLVRAEAKIIHVGRQTATAEGRIVGPNGKLYAHATTTCLIFDMPQ